MIKWLRKNQTPVEESNAELAELVHDNDAASLQHNSNHVTSENVFTRLRRGLSKTRHQLGEGIGRLLLGKKEIDAQLLEDLESLLVSADLGVEMTQSILDELSAALKRNELADGDAVFLQLKKQLQSTLTTHIAPLSLNSVTESPFVILMIGVNGAGKTTTIGKLAKQYQQQGKKVMLAAGDTFRAAAVEQLQVWGERNQIPVIAQHTGADSASVIFDAFQAAKARGADVLIADTAGRLHTQHNLMDELKKVKRVLQKIDPSAPHETMLILDAGIGQNALNQAREFNEAIGLTGITITKLDGTAKGGILFAIANELRIPFRYIGIGEGIDDLRAFDASQFVDAIFNDDHIQSGE
ncbi:MAG: signal recognition particle-docking protein FtsY [Legionellaceae bacterium]|nr:signal recognition particle-docking protein FtsY [Legionellaceae bacterium]